MDLYNGLVGEDRYSRHDADSFEQVLKSPTSFMFIAEDKNKIIGFITFSVRTVVRYPKPIIEFDELYVKTDSRNKGLGTKLMKKAEEEAKKMGAHRIYLESHYKHTAAHALYGKLGYTNYGYHFIKNL